MDDFLKILKDLEETYVNDVNNGCLDDIDIFDILLIVKGFYEDFKRFNSECIHPECNGIMVMSKWNEKMYCTKCNRLAWVSPEKDIMMAISSDINETDTYYNSISACLIEWNEVVDNILNRIEDNDND